MATSDIINYYTNLLIMQYSGQTKAPATVAATVTPVIADQIYTQVRDAFNINTAVGVQLDILGKYIGANRNGYTFGGPTTLGDSDFRTYLKLIIIKNQSTGSLNSIQNLLKLFFPGVIYINDYKNMRISYIVNSSVGSQTLVQFFVKAGALPRPMGVLRSPVIYYSNVSWFFGMSRYPMPPNTTAVSFNVTPFNRYTSVNTSTHWVSYADAI